MSEQIRDTINAIKVLRARAIAAEKAEDAIYAQPDRPQWPTVYAKEFLPAFFPRDCREFQHLEHINEAINLEIRSRRNHHRMMMPPKLSEAMFLTPELQAKLAREVEKLEVMRERLQALWAERKALYDGWRASSGYAEASERARSLWEMHYDLENELLAMPVSSLADLGAKAAYIVTEYGEEYARERLWDFMREVAGFVAPEVQGAIDDPASAGSQAAGSKPTTDNTLRKH